MFFITYKTTVFSFQFFQLVKLKHKLEKNGSTTLLHCYVYYNPLKTTGTSVYVILQLFVCSLPGDSEF